MKKYFSLCTSAVLLTFALSANAATIEIKTLNNGKDGIMVFEPSFVKANKGDTIKFVPTDPAHDVASVSLPKGVKAFSAPVGKPLSIKVTEEGVYFYECKAHLPMAMIGVIQVGNSKANLEEAKKAAKAMAPQFVMNKERVDKYFNQVK